MIFCYSLPLIIEIAFPLSALREVKQIDFSANNFTFHNCWLISFPLAFHHLHTQILRRRFPYVVRTKIALQRNEFVLHTKANLLIKLLSLCNSYIIIPRSLQAIDMPAERVLRTIVDNN